MAKILKHLGIGSSKKVPPQPPKPDYTSSQLNRSPPGPSTSGRHAVTEADLGAVQGSPHRSGSLSHSGSCSHGGARPKEPSGSTSPKGHHSVHAGSTTSGAERTSPTGGGGDGDKKDNGDQRSVASLGVRGPSPSATPPRLLDEYSDPVDLKKQIQEAEELLGVCAVPMDDDYSVPYEVKKLIRARSKEMKIRESALGRSHNGTHEIFRGLSSEADDIRPCGDYDEPWEWSKNQIQQQFDNLPPNFLINRTHTPQLKRTAVANAEASKQLEDSEDTKSPSKETQMLVTESESAVETEAKETVEDSEYETTANREQDAESDDEGYTHLKTDLGPTHLPEQQRAVGNNYEEPWDLNTMQMEISDKLQAVSDRASKDVSKSDSSKITASVRPETDTRSQEGYEKPWDWKPHQKDERSQEGYEKPWDWKPHQKDDRPTAEYEEPWDQRARNIETDLKRAKENFTCSQVSSPAPTVSPPKVPDPKKVEDTRPPEEYDAPWENIVNKPLMQGKKSMSPSHQVASASSNVSEGGVSVQAGRQSPHHMPASSRSPHRSPSHEPSKAYVSPTRKQTKSLHGEKVDPTIPLFYQVWYHGSISRQMAEKLLIVHKEGSYLVRMSESNKLDYSLSVKSAHGIMHMKIVNKDQKGSKFILGQFSQPFDTIPQMVHHYSLNKLPIKGAEHMSLLHPVANDDLL